MRIKKLFLSVLGVVVSSVSIGALKLASFGVDPFQALMSGLDSLVPIDFGTMYAIVNAFLLLFIFLSDRHYIGIVTLVSTLLTGYLIDDSLLFFQMLFPDPSIGCRVILLVTGFLFLCLGCSLTVTADVGVAIYDAIILIAIHKWKLGSYSRVRICADSICVVLGAGMCICSGSSFQSILTVIGIGTIFTAFCMGPLVDWFNRKVSAPILQH